MFSAICSQIPLCGGDVVSFEDVEQRVFVVQLKLQLLSRPVLLLPQEETQQGLTLQRCDVLQVRKNHSLKKKSFTEFSETIKSHGVRTSLAA